MMDASLDAHMGPAVGTTAVASDHKFCLGTGSILSATTCLDQYA